MGGSHRSTRGRKGVSETLDEKRSREEGTGVRRAVPGVSASCVLISWRMQ